MERISKHEFFGVEYSCEREQFEIAYLNDFYAGYRTMTEGQAQEILFGSEEPQTIFDTWIAGESLLNIEEMAKGKTLIVNFFFEGERDTENHRNVKTKSLTFTGSELCEREE